MPCMNRERRSYLADFFRKLIHIYIDSGSNNQIINCIHLHTHFCQNAADFLSVKHRVIRPFNPYRKSQKLPASGSHRHSHQKRNHRCPFRRQFRPYHQSHGNSRPGNRVPAPATPSPSSGLLICNHQSAVRRSLFRHSLCLIIGRINSSKVGNILPRPARLQKAFYLFRRYHIRTRRDMVSLVWNRFNFISFFF